MGFFLAFSASADDSEGNSNSYSYSKDLEPIIFSDSQDKEGDKVSFNPSHDNLLTTSSETVAMKRPQILQDKVRFWFFSSVIHT